MRCQKCNKGIGVFVKKCPKCGKTVTEKQRKKSLISFSIWMGIFLLQTVGSYYSLLDSPPDENFTHFTTFLLALAVAWVSTSFLYLIFLIISGIVRFIIRQPIFGSVIVGLFAAFIGFGIYTYWSDVSIEPLNEPLALIQDNLAEVTVAKLMGDSVSQKRPFINASWERVGMEAQLVSARLKNIRSPLELTEYHNAAIAWSDKMAEAAKNPGTWWKVANDPGDFKLKINKSQAEKLFRTSAQKILALKEFGDSAIKTSNKSAMLYVGAKLKVQYNWLSGIQNTSKKGFASLGIVPPAVAFEIPAIEGVDVTCQACASPTISALQKQQLGCSRCSGGGGQTTNTGTGSGSQTTTGSSGGQSGTGTSVEGSGTGIYGGGNTGQSNTGAGTSGGNKTTTPSGSGSGKKSGSYSATPAGSGGAKKSTPPKVCIGRGGTSYGGKPANVYCVEEALQSMQGIGASIISFANGNSNGKAQWDNGWHKLEGMGIVLEGESAFGKLTPNPQLSSRSGTAAAPQLSQTQKFKDECAKLKGTIGESKIAKSRIPTGELGDTCSYKNYRGKECWDYLTYSGGRYMGGQAGCKEKNLLPNPKDNQKNGVGKWDGHYKGSITASCKTSVKDKPPYSQNLELDFTVVNNITYDKPVDTYVIIDDKGNAIETVQQTIDANGAKANVYMIAYYTFKQEANDATLSVTGSMDSIGNLGDSVYSTSCVLTGSGTRQ